MNSGLRDPQVGDYEHQIQVAGDADEIPDLTGLVIAGLMRRPGKTSGRWQRRLPSPASPPGWLSSRCPQLLPPWVGLQAWPVYC